MSLYSDIFGNTSSRFIKSTKEIVAKINAFEPEIKKLSDKKLAEKTTEFKDKIKNEAYYVIAANAAMALMVAGISDNIMDCRLAAEESILSGRAYDKLNRLKSFGEICS